MAAAEKILSSDSLSHLGDAKKGKSRRFVLVTKGKNIVAMVVFKKGSLETYIKEAKKTGKGTVYHGVVGGKGLNLTFQLAREDKFEAVPGKDQVLKEFLSEQTGEKFKPNYELVESLTIEPDGEEDAAAAATDSRPAAATEAAPAGDDLAMQLEALKGKLLPQIKQAATDPTRKGQIVPLLAAATASEKSGDLQQALAQFQQLEELCSAGASGAEGAGLEFKQRLVSVLKRATPLMATLGEEAKTLAAGARQQADQGNYAEAEALLTQLEQRIEAASSPSSPQDGQTIWTAAQDAVGVQLGQLQQALRETKDPDFERIAEFGLNGVTGKLQVPFRAALMEWGQGADAARERVLQLATEYEAFLQDNQLIALVDENPFGVTVSIRGTLLKALADVRALATAS